MFRRFHYNSPVILTMTILSFGALLLGYATDFKSTALLFSVYRGSFTDIFFYFRLIGHVLGHADWGHFINNFLLILLLGPMLEEKYGSKNIISMILATALITGVLNIILFNSALLGASGIVFMLIVLSSFANTRQGTIPITLILVIVIFIGREIMDGLLTKDNISQLTHIIGGLCGAIFGMSMTRSRKEKRPT